MSADYLMLKPVEFAATHGSLVANVSGQAERFAREHGLWGSLVILKTILIQETALIDGVNVELVPDPEVRDRFLISFNLRTHRPVAEVPEFDDRVRAVIYDEIPAADQVYFAVHFDFV